MHNWIKGLFSEKEKGNEEKKRGDACLQHGDLSGAEQHYRLAISTRPDHIDALSSLGFTLKEQGRYEEAQDFLQRAIKLDPSHTDSYYFLGSIAQQQGQQEQAIDLLRQVLQLDPAFEFAYRDLCLLFFQSGNIDAVKHTLQEAMQHFPSSAEFRFFSGNMHYEEGNLDQAGLAFRETISLAPHFALAHVNLGVVLQDQGHLQLAQNALDEAVKIDPGVADWHLKRGYLAQRQGDFETATVFYRQAITLQPDLAQAHANLGSLFEQRGNLEQALSCYRRAWTLKPDKADMAFNIGAVLQTQRQLDEALTYYHHSLTIDASHFKTLVNMAALLDAQGRYDDSLACYDNILAQYPEQAQVHVNKAYLLLRLGRYPEGWKEYEYRWQCPDAPPRPAFPQPLWLGEEDLSGKTILLYGEQGFGDMLHFMRYTRLVASLGARVYLQVPSALVSLAASCAGVTRVFASLEEVPPFDYLCPLMSLPLACKTTLSTIPGDTPYLAPDPAKIIGWSKKLGEKTKLRIGLAWAGDARKSQPMAAAMDRQRSMRFDQLLPLLEVQEVEFFSLQVGEEARRQLDQHPLVIDFTDELKDFQDTAALIENLDLVISVDTSIVHLSGAIGKPVWMLDRLGHCYRWLPGRTDSPWYPTLRIFRQFVMSDWGSVVNHARLALTQRVGNVNLSLSKTC